MMHVDTICLFNSYVIGLAGQRLNLQDTHIFKIHIFFPAHFVTRVIAGGSVGGKDPRDLLLSMYLSSSVCCVKIRLQHNCHTYQSRSQQVMHACLQQLILLICTLSSTYLSNAVSAHRAITQHNNPCKKSNYEITCLNGAVLLYHLIICYLNL